MQPRSEYRWYSTFRTSFNPSGKRKFALIYPGLTDRQVTQPPQYSMMAAKTD